MSSRRTYTDYLNDILDYASKAEEFVRDVNFKDP